MTHSPAAGPRHLATYVLLSLIWGLSFLFTLRVSRSMGMVGAVSFRALVAAATIVLAAPLAGRRLNLRGNVPAFLVVGATTVVGQLAPLSYSTRAIGTAMSAILVGTIPLFSMLLAYRAGSEPLTVRRVGGVLLAIAGLVLLVGFPAVAMTPRFLAGCLLAVFGSFCAAFGSNYAVTHLRALDPLSLAAGSFLAGGLLGLPLWLIEPIRAWPSLMDLANLVVLGSVIGALAYVMFFWLLGAIGPTRATSVEFIVNVNGALIGVWFLGEHLSPLQLLGAIAVLAGCAIVLELGRVVRDR